MTSNPNLAEDDSPSSFPLSTNKSPSIKEVPEKSWFFGIQHFNSNEPCEFIVVEKTSVPTDGREPINVMASQLEKGCINKETGFLLQASRSDAKKSLFHKALNSPVVLAVMDKAKEIAIKSKHIESHADIQHGNTHVQAIHIFAVPILLNQIYYRLELTVRDYWESKNSRKMIHSIDGIQLEKIKTFVWEHPAQEVTRAKSSARCQTGQPTNEGRDILPNLSSSILFKDLISGYVRADGKGYFDEINPDEFRLDGAYKSEVRDSVLVRYFYEEIKKTFSSQLRKAGFLLNQVNSEVLIKKIYENYQQITQSGEQLTNNKGSFERLLRLKCKCFSPLTLGNFSNTRTNNEMEKSL